MDHPHEAGNDSAEGEAGKRSKTAVLRGRRFRLPATPTLSLPIPVVITRLIRAPTPHQTQAPAWGMDHPDKPGDDNEGVVIAGGFEATVFYLRTIFPWIFLTFAL